MNKQINFRAPEYIFTELDLISKKVGIDKTTAIIWAINKLAESYGITNADILSQISKNK